MPLKIKLYPNSTLKTIESFQKSYGTKSYESLSEEDKATPFVSILALRAGANAVRGEKSSLKVPMDQDKFNAAMQSLGKSATFNTFAKEQGLTKLEKLAKKGHGGEAEDAFQKYVMDKDKLPADVPDRWMPKAKDRIEQQQKKLENLHPTSDEAIAAYAEIFRCRRAVNAARNTPGTLEPHINGSAYARQPDLADSETFKDFVRDKGSRLKKTAVTGHGGAAEDMFKEHVLQYDRLPGDVPAAYMPDAVKRTEALQEKLRNTTEPGRVSMLYSELMATREAVAAERGSKKSLERTIDFKELEKARQTWDSCETFHNYLIENRDEAREAVLKGHGGALSDKFNEYVKNLDHIPEDVPKGNMPTAYDHIEALQKKYKGIGYVDSSDERKLTLAAEIMASRQAVGAVRGNKDSLKKPMDPQELQAACNTWKSCEAFADFVKNEGQKVYEGAVDGHGGALGDKFKEYVVTLDELKPDIPAAYLPTARLRTEALQKKIRESTASAADNKKLYAELMATRGSVGAVRGKKGSLDVQLEPEALDKRRTELMGSDAFQLFLADTSQTAAIRKAALDGHGGSLEDAFRTYVGSMDRIPANTPERYMPTALERTELLQKKLEKGNFESKEAKVNTYVELMASREAVGAIRKNKKSLEKTIDASSLAAAREKWDQCQTFKDYVASDDLARNAALAGHGGELMDKFKEYVNQMDYMPTDLPGELIPDADARIEALQKKLKEDEFMDFDEKSYRIAQILAARSNVNAQRNKKETLKHRLDPGAVNDKADSLFNSAAFRSFVEENEEKLDKLAQSGHGGEMEDEFKKFVAAMPELPSDVSREYMPTAKARVEGLQEKIKSAEFRNFSDEVKLNYFAELMAARRSVGAERNKKETLNTNVDPAKAAEMKEKLLQSDAFKDYIRNNLGEARSAATSGHGGELEDCFKKHVLKMNKIPADVPKDYMPTAKERTESLQDIVKSRDFSNRYDYVQQVSVYRELLATRAAVNSLRGDKKSLDTTLDPEQLQNMREELANCSAVTDFLENADERLLMDAATSGHGGALEDKVKDHIMKQSVADGSIPEKLPDRLKPSAADLQESIRTQLAADVRDRSPQYLEIFKQDYMRKVACSMYLAKLQRESQSSGVSPVLDKAVMDRNVNKLMNSEAFQNMFATADNTRLMISHVATKHMSDVFTRFAEAQGQFELEGHQPVLEHQPIQNQQQLNQNDPNLAQHQAAQNIPNVPQFNQVGQNPINPLMNQGFNQNQMNPNQMNLNQMNLNQMNMNQMNPNQPNLNVNPNMNRYQNQNQNNQYQQNPNGQYQQNPNNAYQQNQNMLNQINQNMQHQQMLNQQHQQQMMMNRNRANSMQQRRGNLQMNPYQQQEPQAGQNQLGLG